MRARGRPMHNEIPRTLPEAIGDYAAAGAARFHMPGHKGQGMMGPLGMALAPWDVTELPGTDDLHAPEGAILAAERAYAEAYGARQSFLLVGGSTAGILAMLLALGKNKRVLLARDCHKSAVAGVALAGHACDFIYPETAVGAPFCGVVTPEAVETALARRRADAVFITSPNYYGACADVAGIAEVCRRHSALLLCDQAHGAHFPFVPGLSAHAASAADLWCVSAHKTLRAMTQSAVLHASPACPLSDAHIRKTLSLIETSSPSYPLMLSLDWALNQAKTGEWERHTARVLALRARFAAHPVAGVSLLEAAGPFAALDFTRLVFLVNGRGISGAMAQDALIGCGVVPEMADLASVVCITSPADPDAWYARLFAALTALPLGNGRFSYLPPVAVQKTPVLRVRDALLSPSEPVLLENCAGRICAQAAGAYPPGVATLFPGERIEEADVRRMLAFREAGLSLFGVAEGRTACVKEEKAV
jgi:arginine decarboxylase